MTAIELEDIKAEMCDSYCRYPNQYVPSGETYTDDVYQLMLDERCDKCPLGRISIDE